MAEFRICKTTSRKQGGSMTLAELKAYKDGITDALLEGYISDWHDNFYYYKRGYQFGIHLQKEIREIEELKEEEA